MNNRIVVNVNCTNIKWCLGTNNDKNVNISYIPRCYGSKSELTIKKGNKGLFSQNLVLFNF